MQLAYIFDQVEISANKFAKRPYISTIFPLLIFDVRISIFAVTHYFPALAIPSNQELIAANKSIRNLYPLLIAICSLLAIYSRF